MTANEFLNRPNEIRRELKEKVELLERLKSRAEVRGISYTGHGSGSDGNRADDLLARIADLESEIRELSFSYNSAVYGLETAIARMDGVNLRQVLYLHYIKGWTYAEIAEDMHYSVSHVKHLSRLGKEKIIPFFYETA